jgi:hypothetical protein
LAGRQRAAAGIDVGRESPPLSDALDPSHSPSTASGKGPDGMLVVVRHAAPAVVERFECLGRSADLGDVAGFARQPEVPQDAVGDRSRLDHRDDLFPAATFAVEQIAAERALPGFGPAPRPRGDSMSRRGRGSASHSVVQW